MIDRRSHVALDADGLPRVRLEKRAPRAKCSALVNPDDVQKRDVSTISGRGMSLARRTMTLPDGDMNQYMMTEIGNCDRPIIWQTGRSTNPSESATAGVEAFGDKAFSVGTSCLSGCTVLWIISRTGVYFAHYWENISFAPDRIHFKGDAEKAFEGTVVKGLREGVSKRGFEQQASLAGAVPDLADDHVKVYLMRPTEAWDDRVGAYQDKWDRMKEIVVELIPKVAEDGRWQEVTYEALNNFDPLLRTSARGHTLFKFDPDHNGKKKATMWVEAEPQPYHDDEW